ncbi:hypothetical protein FE784_37570 [Paenibacillus hemerocallicola]|uniref:CBM-cenC domain-containing protein n=1 Tax=Paenibacillus hemerocallicola TaxID=1172614 RepID=A0A5C4SWJ8_9BACL|nr:hypothetical protein [Paenibacillus hemerocallicola]TNJ59189.1 hypothetical protein FE784_37570 [Paenibacillus hemerocallicola]
MKPFDQRNMNNVQRTGLCALLALILLFGTVPAAFASGNDWYDDYLAYESSQSGNYYASSDSALLGWQESYMLRSYINLYDMTKNTGWLDKFTLHADTVLGNADDSDGDGYLGWSTYRYSPNLTTNGTFASGASGDAALPAGWTRFQSTSATAYRSNGSGAYNTVASDAWGLVLKTNGTSWQKLYQSISYEPKTKYRVSFYGKTNGSAAKGRVYVHDRTANTILASVIFDNTSWQNFTVDFTAPAVSGHNLELWLAHADYTATGGIAYFDDVALNGWFPYIVHDGMIGVPIAEFIRLVDRSPTALSAYAAKAAAYRQFIENEIVPRWESSSYIGNTWVSATASAGYYKEPPNVDSFATTTALDPLPYNQFLAFAELLAIMHDVNGSSAYLDKAKKMGQYFKNSLTTVGSAYDWDYAGYTTRTEDTSHANVDLTPVTELFNKGQIFDGTDLGKFSATLTTKVWNGSLSSPKLHNYVDGTQGTLASDFLYTKDMSGWLKLAQFDPTAWTIGAGQYGSSPPSRFIEALVLSLIMKWDPVKLVNQGFELKSGGDATLPARWTRFQSTAATAYLDAANKASGGYGLTIVSNGASWQKAYQEWKQYKASTDYVVTFDAKTDGSAAGGKVWVVNETTGSTTAAYNFTNTAWQTHTFAFSSPANTTDEIRVYLGHNSYTTSGGKAYFDNVVIKQSGDAW